MKDIREKSIFHKSYGHDKMKFFPKPIYKAITEEKPHMGLKNELYPTQILDCPRKVVVMKWIEDMGYRKVQKEKNKWYPFRGNVWDDYLSRLFDSQEEGHSQISIMTVIPVEDDVVIIRGRIDAIYKENEKWKLIDFKTTKETKLLSGEHIYDRYIAQISFYSKIMNIEEFGLFFITNAAPAYEKYEDESGILRTYIYDEMVKRAIEIYKAYKNGYLPPEKDQNACRFCPIEPICHRLENSPEPKKTLRENIELLETIGKIEKKK